MELVKLSRDFVINLPLCGLGCFCSTYLWLDAKNVTVMKNGAHLHGHCKVSSKIGALEKCYAHLNMKKLVFLPIRALTHANCDWVKGVNEH